VRFYFIRHGQSENNALWQRTGSSKGRNPDAELTDVGRRQAEVLAQFLGRGGLKVAVNDRDPENAAGFGITHLYSSLMVRAVATGTILAGALGLPLAAWEDLHEGGGIYVEDERTSERTGLAGHNQAYFAAHYPDLVLPGSLGEAGWWGRPFEDREQRLVRARRFWHDLLGRHGQTNDRVVVVSHGGFYNDLLATLLRMTGRDGYWFVLNNAAITRIDFHAERVDLVYLNRVDFLPPELVT